VEVLGRSSRYVRLTMTAVISLYKDKGESPRNGGLYVILFLEAQPLLLVEPR